jgi:hypothetical protein
MKLETLYNSPDARLIKIRAARAKDDNPIEIQIGDIHERHTIWVFENKVSEANRILKDNPHWQGPIKISKNIDHIDCVVETDQYDKIDIYNNY